MDSILETLPCTTCFVVGPYVSPQGMCTCVIRHWLVVSMCCSAVRFIGGLNRLGQQARTTVQSTRQHASAQNIRSVFERGRGAGYKINKDTGW